MKIKQNNMFIYIMLGFILAFMVFILSELLGSHIIQVDDHATAITALEKAVHTLKNEHKEQVSIPKSQLGTTPNTSTSLEKAVHTLNNEHKEQISIPKSKLDTTPATSTSIDNTPRILRISLTPNNWGSFYHALGFIGLGVFICFIYMVLFKKYYLKTHNVKDIKISHTDDIKNLVTSYETIISTYKHSLTVFFGLFALLGISSVVLNWSGAKQLDRIEDIKKKLELEAQLAFNQLKDQAEQSIHNIEINSDKTIQTIKLLNEAYSCYNKGTDIEYANAITLSKQVLSIDKTNTSAYVLQGMSYSALKNERSTIECFNKATEINKNDDTIYYNKGIALANLNKYEDAIEAYKKAIEINNNFDIAYYNKGAAQYALGKHEDAIEAYKNAIEINNNYDMAYCNKGSALDDLGKHEDAIKAYKKAIKINPKNDIAYYNKGAAQYALGKHEDAIEAYKKAIEINNNFDMAYYNMGNALAELTRYEDAIEAFNKAIEINPENPGYYNLACAYAQWHKSDTDLDSKPENTLELCKENLIKAKKSSELKKAGIEHIKNDSDFDSIKNEKWFNDIMREAFGDEWDKDDEDNNSTLDKAE